MNYETWKIKIAALTVSLHSYIICVIAFTNYLAQPEVIKSTLQRQQLLENTTVRVRARIGKIIEIIDVIVFLTSSKMAKTFL